MGGGIKGGCSELESGSSGTDRSPSSPSAVASRGRRENRHVCWGFCPQVGRVREGLSLFSRFVCIREGGHAQARGSALGCVHMGSDGSQTQLCIPKMPSLTRCLGECGGLPDHRAPSVVVPPGLEITLQLVRCAFSLPPSLRHPQALLSHVLPAQIQVLDPRELILGATFSI